MSFRNREEAGRQLAAALDMYRDQDCVVFALPRGGVPVAAPIASALHAPLDLILVRKIGTPFQRELAMGALADAGGALVLIRNEDIIRLADVSEADFDAVVDEERGELDRRRQLFFGDRLRAEAKGKVAIVVDDGIATGATTRAALRAARALQPQKLVLATPVAPTEALDALATEADEIVCLENFSEFGAVGAYYDDFRQVEDAEVAQTLRSQRSAP
jgi:putative phosphoribosyl transferase